MKKKRERIGIEDKEKNHEKARQERSQVQKRLQAQQSWGVQQVMEKYGNKSPLMKILHKYTGFIVVGIILAISIPVIHSMIEDQEFFEKWSCSQINYYLNYDQETQNNEMPDHDNLSDKQHQRLHEIISECNIEHKFN